ncbi:DUF3100 domain-containing protein [Sediminivirga luteola]|jgi:hypothetical protein|uniref:DUF3100 domain-containing protein n=1 Tax=Sediminivirga luteola TaxID=1774748 RepID=UPI001F5963BB|nr:DUF3100 domain-containing protein [Sediminivirga luteola]MCI2264474.1 DUF3100 domain-containing protein [Sediminivirga luteola]
MTSVRDVGAAWRLYVAAAVLVLVAQLIGIQQLDLGVGVIMFLPLLYAFVLGLVLNPSIVGRFQPFLKSREVAAASPLIVVAIMPFIAKFGTTIGPDIEQIIAAGPALLLQELGNLGTVILAFPLAVWLLKLGRESVGATFSVAREPSIAIVAERYGLKSPEGTGVLAVYVVGTLFGTILYSVMASFIASTGVFDIRALAMACGVGSGSMMAACSGSLAAAVPEMESTILAFAGSSNLLTYATGMYLSLFVALPAVEWMYRRWGRPATAVAATGASTGGDR